MGQEHSLPVGDRCTCATPSPALHDVACPCNPETRGETVEEYLARCHRNVAEAKRILGVPLHQPKVCRDCVAPIFWAQDARNLAMTLAVDAHPIEGGTIQLSDRNGSIVATVYPVPPPGTKLRRFHNCPGRPQHEETR